MRTRYDRRENEIRYLSALNKEKDLAVRFSDDGYIAVYCTKNGVRMRAVTKKPAAGFVVRYDSYGYLRLPESIVKAYRLDKEEFQLVTVDKGKEYLIEKKCDGEIPTPLIGNLNYDDSEIDPDDYEHIKSRRGLTAKMQTTGSLYLNGLMLFSPTKVTVHMGTCLRIDLTMPDKEDLENLPHYADLKKEYKANLANFCGEQISYLCDAEETIKIPKPFRIAAQLEKGDELYIYIKNIEKQKRDHSTPFTYMLAPAVSHCAFCGEEIDPRKEVPKETVLCPDCEEEPEEFSKIIRMVNEVKEYADKVKERAERAERRAKSAEESNDQLRERLMQLEEESLSDKEKIKAITALIAGGTA